MDRSRLRELYRNEHKHLTGKELLTIQPHGGGEQSVRVEAIRQSESQSARSHGNAFGTDKIDASFVVFLDTMTDGLERHVQEGDRVETEEEEHFRVLSATLHRWDTQQIVRCIRLRFNS